MVGIVIALASEAKALLESISEKNQITLSGKTAYECKIGGHNAIICISGIGKVSSALATQLIIDKYSPDFILNYGTCGGMNNNVKILGYYAIENVCQYDFDLTKLDDVSLGYIQDYDRVFFSGYTNGIDLPKANLATSDRFTSEINDVETVNSLGCSVCDMEGGAIAQVCTSNNVPVVMIKGISDVYGSGTASEQFYKNLKAVSEGFPAVIKKVIDNVCKNIAK